MRDARGRYRAMSPVRSPHKEAVIPARTPQEALATFQAAFNAGRLNDVLALYEPDATLALVDDAPVRGLEAIAASIAAFMARGLAMSMWPTRVIVAEHGLAMLTGGWTAEGRAAGGAPVRLFGTCHIVMRRQGDGSWRYLIDDPGFGRPPPSPD